MPISTSPSHDPATLPRLLLIALALLFLWPGISISRLDPTVLLEQHNLHTMGLFLSDFWPLAHDAEFLRLLWTATLQTVSIATAGIALALILALPASLLVSRAVSVSVWRTPVRSVLIVLRSVPEIVWALLLVRAVGLGPTAGVLAIAITYSGMLGKVYAEIFESADTRPAKALQLSGASRLPAFFYGVLPQAAPEMLSYTVYRWECAVRTSVVLGFVGAGGLGQQLDLSMRMFAGAEVASLLLTFLVLVLLADQISQHGRRALDNTKRVQLIWCTGVLTALFFSLQHLDLEFYSFLSENSRTHMLRYVSGFFPPDLTSQHWQLIAHGALQTLAMSAIGTLLAAVLGLLLALPAAGRAGALLKAATRILLNALRAIPELVWASLMVLAAGLGSNAGTLALALHTTGVLGRLFAEALENLPAQPSQALRLSGSGRIAALCYGSLPVLWPQLLAYTLYRWENNIRMASVLGFVGAGGLGQMLYFHLGLFQESQATSIIFSMLLLVLGVDMLSNRLRHHWVRN
jgi:phosphonate transport system permease protein